MLRKSIIYLIAFLALVGCAILPTSSSNDDEEKRNMFTSVITKFDKKGRALVVELKTPYGGCISEAVYTSGEYPEIHVVVTKNGGMRNIGYLLMRHLTEETITNKDLLFFFNQAINEQCLPLLLPGHAKV